MAEGEAILAVIEVRAADGNVIGGGSDAIDLQADIGLGLLIEVVTASRAGVSRGDKDRLALRGGLLPERVPEGIAALAQKVLALAVAGADDAGLIVLHGAQRGQGQAVGEWPCRAEV